MAPSAEAHTAAPVAAYTARSTLGSRDLGHSEPTNFIVRAVGKGVLQSIEAELTKGKPFIRDRDALVLGD